MQDLANRIVEGGDIRRAVEEFFRLDASGQARLLDTLWAPANAHVASFLAEVLPGVADKKIQKQVKRLLFRLKTKGISIEEPKPTGAPVLKTFEEPREERAYLTNYDGTSLRAVLIIRGIKRNQLVFVHGVTHFSDGLVQLAGAPLPRSEIDTFIADYQMRTPSPIVLVPIAPSYAAHLVEEAYRVSGKQAAEIEQLRPFMAKLGGDVRTRDDLHHLAVPATASPVPVEELLGNEMFAPFRLEWEGIEKDREKLREASNPSIVLPPYMVKERTDRLIQELEDDERVRAKTGPLKRLLEDYAYLFFGLRQYDRYLAAIRAIDEEATFRRVLRHFVAGSMEKEKKESPQEQSIIVSPYTQK